MTPQYPKTLDWDLFHPPACGKPGAGCWVQWELEQDGIEAPYATPGMYRVQAFAEQGYSGEWDKYVAEVGDVGVWWEDGKPDPVVHPHEEQPLPES